MTNVEPNNGNETKSEIFLWVKFKSDDKFFLSKKLKYFNDFQHGHFLVLWLKWTQTMEMKQD